VRKRKLGEFEQQIHNQEAALIREKKNTVPTEMDKALNDSKISKALAIFGGHSGEQRAAAASERVSLMEDEKDLIEAINQAKTKEEKDLLRKQLAEMRKVRRELEKSLK
jgi:predicted aminopeptidase